jgi:hypothetical protein
VIAGVILCVAALEQTELAAYVFRSDLCLECGVHGLNARSIIIFMFMGISDVSRSLKFRGKLKLRQNQNNWSLEKAISTKKFDNSDIGFQGYS